jgi:ERCC4-type nuclease
MGILSCIIDSREPDWVKKLTFGGVPTVVSELPTSDALIAMSDNALVAVERKTPNDFLGSLKSGRLMIQVTAMRELTQWSYVVITGELRRGKGGKVVTDRETGWDWNAVNGELLRIQELGVFVAFCAGDDEFENAVLRITNRNRATVHIAPPAIAKHVLGPGEAAIASLPGVGFERLGALMEYCKNPITALICLTDEELGGVPGIGPAVKRGVRKALGMPDWMALEMTTKVNTTPQQLAQNHEDLVKRWKAEGRIA